MKNEVNFNSYYKRNCTQNCYKLFLTWKSVWKINPLLFLDRAIASSAWRIDGYPLRTSNASNAMQTWHECHLCLLGVTKHAWTTGFESWNRSIWNKLWNIMVKERKCLKKFLFTQSQQCLRRGSAHGASAAPCDDAHDAESVVPACCYGILPRSFHADDANLPIFEKWWWNIRYYHWEWNLDRWGVVRLQLLFRVRWDWVSNTYRDDPWASTTTSNGDHDERNDLTRLWK